MNRRHLVGSAVVATLPFWPRTRIPATVAQGSSPLTPHTGNTLHLSRFETGWVAPSIVSGGPTIIRLENNLADKVVSPLFARFQDEQTASSLIPFWTEPGVSPALMEAAYFPGVPADVPPNNATAILMDLLPGFYVIKDEFTVALVVESAPTNETDRVPRAEAVDVSATLGDDEIQVSFKSPLDPGSIWEVSNAGNSIQRLMFAAVSAGSIPDSVMKEIDANGGQIPKSQQIPGGIGWMSPGSTAYLEEFFVRGTYAAIAWTLDPETSTASTSESAIHVFTGDKS